MKWHRGGGRKGEPRGNPAKAQRYEVVGRRKKRRAAQLTRAVPFPDIVLS